MRSKDYSEQYDCAIAVVGMACRFPQANSPSEFWQNLAAGRSSIQFFNATQLSAAGIEDALFTHQNFVAASGHLQDVDQFDAEFFKFTAQEAVLMDPQFRLFFECAWEAFEDAGYVPDKILNKVGVFAGAGMSLYASNFMRDYFSTVLVNCPQFLENFSGPQVIIANKTEYLPTRVAYKFNLRGPSVNVQTACSTSLVAVHIAVLSLLSGESDMALAGASAIHFPIHAGYLYSEGGMYARDGKCKAFSHDADGIVGGNGVGVVLLKRLSDALKDKDNILAIIRSSAINNDGADKVSYMAPSVSGQKAVLRLALDSANITADQITYVEAHGTGTPLGDPIEFTALKEVFEQQSNNKQYCALGSVKTNIGHLDTAAGMAGLIKTILSLQNQLIPASLHFTQSNPNIDLTHSPFYVNIQLKSWCSEQPRMAGVSALGAGGTNAHVIVEEYLADACDLNDDDHLFLLSAKSKNALQAYINKYLQFLSQADINLKALAYTQAFGREHFNFRYATTFKNKSELIRTLQQAEVQPFTNQKIAFLFTGQGAQYAGMGKYFYETYTVFREGIDTCSHSLLPTLGVTVPQLLWGDASTKLHDTAYTQPALFAFQYALAQLWLSFGIKPDIVMGHSVGEYCAACIAGVMSLADGLRLIAERARLMQALPSGGGMIAIFAHVSAITPYLQDYTDTAIAAINGPENVVVAGPIHALTQLAERLDQEKNIKYHPLIVSHAFHSPLMRPMLASFQKVAESIRYQQASIPIISNLTGKFITEINAAYWLKHIMAPVQFAASIDKLAQLNCHTLVEIGPKSTLLAMAKACSKETEFTYLESAHPRFNHQTLLKSLAALYLQRKDINWRSVWQDKIVTKISLPTYPFQRQSYWPKANMAIKCDDWLREMSWQIQPLINKSVNHNRQTYLIFTDQQEIAEIIQKSFHHQAQLIMHHDHDALKKEDNFYLLNFAHADHITLFFEKYLAKQQSYQVLFISGIANHQMDQANITYFKNKIYPGLLHLLQVCQKHTNISKFTLVVEYKQKLAVALMGILNAARAENMPFKLQSILFDEFSLSTLLSEIDPQSDDWIVQYEEGKRYIPHLIAANPATSGKHVLDVNAYYVITGGLGGIGKVVIDYLRAQGVKHFILLQRSSVKNIAQYEADGIDFIVHACDVSDFAQMQSTFEALKNYCIKGVIHAAGVLADGFIQKQNLKSLQETALAKIQGSFNLYHALQDRDLDFFINFSSIASVVGSPGQANYALANCFLDYFTDYLRAQKIMATVINWGPWDKIGMAQHQHAEHPAIKQFSKITKNIGTMALHYAITYRPKQLLVFKTIVTAPTTISALQDWLWLSPQVNNSKPNNFTETEIKNMTLAAIQKVLGCMVIDEEMGFQDLGMDSMMGLQLCSLLLQTFQISLPSTLIYQYPNTRTLINMICEHFQTQEPVVENIDKRTTDDIANLLAQELAQR